MIEDKDMSGTRLYDDGDHRFIWLGADPRNREGVVQTMQYLIIDKGRGILLDPGGVHLFPRVVAAASRYISVDRIDTIFFSHQDPDVSSGIALWMGVTPARIYIPGLWTRFLPHFGIVDHSRITPIEELGKGIRLPSGAELVFVPSHYMHSPAAFSLYDAKARILFSGDIGAAVFPEGEETLFVDDFKSHVHHIEGFHKRLIAGNEVAKRWVANVRRLAPAMIAPQHGAVYRDASVGAFLDWLSLLRCGIDELDTLYRM
ncbi:MAG: MBL fold metallo-hydrolase [Spirochaetes bacterium RIFOXYC1_FULL_54_7]|nr:MAG: MBL fold metallo-hydrolase [Spirochaetes bacterium RIFOXYC1_FULL_54_7]